MLEAIRGDVKSKSCIGYIWQIDNITTRSNFLSLLCLSTTAVITNVYSLSQEEGTSVSLTNCYIIFLYFHLLFSEGRN